MIPPDPDSPDLLALDAARPARRRTLSPEEIARFRAGDGVLLGTLYTELATDLLQAARPYADDRDDAEDIVQETWIQAYKSRHTFRGDAPVFEWLRRVMETTGTDRVRTLLRRRAKAAEWLMESVFGQPEESDVHAKLAAVELRVRLIQALVRLPARQCDVMVARFLGGLTIRQIAVNLGIAEGTVKATLAQATERLRGALGSTPPD